MKNHIINLRPYSWVDLIFLGYLAKFSITKNLDFVFSDFYLASGLLLLWAFYNFILEAKHNYAYRGKTSVSLPTVALVLAVVLSAYQNVSSLIPLTASVLLVLVYLQKNRNVWLGNLSFVMRGLIQSCYFLYAVLFLGNSIGQHQIIISVLILIIYAVRALMGDVRDVEHNRKANKQTFPVKFGVTRCKVFMVALLGVAVVIQIMSFDSYSIALPLVLFAVSLVAYGNGYVLHQLSILMTTFFHIDLISLFTNQSLIFANMIFVGIVLNFVFYPLLDRKSNPSYVHE